MQSMTEILKNKQQEITSSTNRHNSPHFKYMRFVALIYLTLLMAATVSAYKIVQINFFPEPGSTLIYTFSFFWGNVFAEVYGSNRTKQLIWESIVCGYIFAILITVINCLPSPGYWDIHQAYDQVLGNVLRFTTAGTIGHICSAFLNVYLLTRWKLKMNGRMFWLRSLTATTLSEGVATFIAGIITFFHMTPMQTILYLMTNALIFKIAYGMIAVWPTSLMAFWLKKKEGMIYEQPTLNPFNFTDKKLEMIQK